MEQESYDMLGLLIDKLEKHEEVKMFLRIGEIMHAIDEGEDPDKEEVDELMSILIKGLSPRTNYSPFFIHLCATAFRHHAEVDDEQIKESFPEPEKKGLYDFKVRVRSSPSSKKNREFREKS